MINKKLLLLVVILLIEYFLFTEYITDNLLIKAFILLPLSFITTLFYFIYYNVDLIYLFIPFMTGITIFFFLLLLNMEYQYSKYYGVISETNKAYVISSIMVIITIIYILNNKKCNLSKVMMIILLISVIQAYYQMSTVLTDNNE